MTDYTKPISASNPPESKGTQDVRVVEQPLIIEDSEQKVEPKEVKPKKSKAK